MRNKKVTLLWASDHRNPHAKASRILCRLCRKAQPDKRPKTVYSPLPEQLVNLVENTLNIDLHIGNEQHQHCCRRNAIQTNAKRNHSFPFQTAVNGTPFSLLRLRTEPPLQSSPLQKCTTALQSNDCIHRPPTADRPTTSHIKANCCVSTAALTTVAPLSLARPLLRLANRSLRMECATRKSHDYGHLITEIHTQRLLGSCVCSAEKPNLPNAQKPSTPHYLGH